MAAVLIEDRLAEFLRRAASEKRVPGEWDCAMTLANWVRSVTGIDPAFGLRGTYSEAEWPAIVEKEGGLVALVGRLAVSAGLEPTATPASGDIGVVESKIGPTGAIKTATRWAMKVGAGVVAVRNVKLLAAWKVIEARAI